MIGLWFNIQRRPSNHSDAKLLECANRVRSVISLTGFDIWPLLVVPFTPAWPWIVIFALDALGCCECGVRVSLLRTVACESRSRALEPERTEDTTLDTVVKSTMNRREIRKNVSMV